jgi:hypothetical protein
MGETRALESKAVQSLALQITNFRLSARCAFSTHDQIIDANLTAADVRKKFRPRRQADRRRGAPNSGHGGSGT